MQWCRVDFSADWCVAWSQAFTHVHVSFSLSICRVRLKRRDLLLTRPMLSFLTPLTVTFWLHALWPSGGSGGSVHAESWILEMTWMLSSLCGNGHRTHWHLRFPLIPPTLLTKNTLLVQQHHPYPPGRMLRLCWSLVLYCDSHSISLGLFMVNIWTEVWL